MSYFPSDFYFYDEDHARETRDAEQAETLAEDERAEFLAREMAFIEMNACNETCFATATHHAGCLASGAWQPVEAAVFGWARSQGLQEAA